MLKRIVSLVLILPIVLASAYTSPVYATSAQVVVAQVQAGGDGAATQEFVTLYNNGNQPVDIKDWCLKNKSNSVFACFTTERIGENTWLPPYSYAVAATQAFVDANHYTVTLVYAPSNASSGSIVGSADTISLIDASGNMIDDVTWTTKLEGGQVYQRGMSSFDPVIYIDNNFMLDWLPGQFGFFPDVVTLANEFLERDMCANFDGMQTTIPFGYGSTGQSECAMDVCSNIIGIQSELPSYFYADQHGECWRYFLPIEITELLPNAVGSDDGKEFVEIYNPNDQPVDLSEYALLVGLEPTKKITLSQRIIEPHSYAVIWNSEVAFTLVNTAGAVYLRSIDGSFEVASLRYDSPKEGESWALIDGNWQYTNQPTPGAVNVPSVADDSMSANNSANSSASSLKPCAANQERNPETNRCRNIASSTSNALTPCKEGQERNPETNRCRNVTSMPSVGYEVLGASTTNDVYWWYIAAAIIGLIVIAGGYAVWEWRREVARFLHKLTGFVRIRK